MTSAASHSPIIRPRSGGMLTRRGSISNHRAHSTRSSAMRGSRARVERDGSNVLCRNLAENRDRRDRTVRRDRHARHDAVVVPGIFDRRDQPEIDLVGVEQLRALRGHVEPQTEPSRLAAVEPVHQRTRVEIADGSETDGMLVAPSESAVPFDRLEAGRPNAPADFFDRRTAASLRLVVVCGDTESMSSAPNVSATCASFGPYSAQST